MLSSFKGIMSYLKTRWGKRYLILNIPDFQTDQTSGQAPFLVVFEIHSHELLFHTYVCVQLNHKYKLLSI